MFVKIPDGEYLERVKKCSEMVAQKGYDVMVVTGAEGDYQNVKYFTSVTPVWERLGVIIAANGNAAMITGPEGLTYCQQYCKLDKVFALNCFRSSMDPVPGTFKMDTFRGALSELGLKGDHLKICMGNIIDTSVVIYRGLKEEMPNAEWIEDPEIMRKLRAKKSEAEIACLKESYRIVEMATDVVLEKMRPGMTETNLIGIAHEVIYANGAEHDGMPNYCFFDQASMHPLGRARSDRILQKNSFVQLGFSASVDGYCGSVGIPVSVGHFTVEQKELVDLGLEVYKWSRKNVFPGQTLGAFEKGCFDIVDRAGLRKYCSYCCIHGLGLAEVETYSLGKDELIYPVEPGYTYQTDSFFIGKDFGFRYETGVVCRENGPEDLGRNIGQIYELGF